MNRRLMTIITALMFIGIIAVALNMLLGGNTITYIETYTEEISGLQYYKFNFFDYIQNFQLAQNGLPKITLPLPTRTWQITDASIIESEFWEILGNNMAVILNYIIMILNVILMPLRYGGYLIYNVIAILGFNVQPNAPMRWLYDLGITIMNIAIPYI